MQLFPVSAVVNVKEKEVEVEYNDDENDHNGSDDRNSLAEVLVFLHDGLNDPNDVEKDLDAESDSSDESALFALAWVVLGPREEEVPYESGESD
jgi:hypothetical protein